MKKKFYVVWEGKKKGIFDNWENCKAQVIGQEGAKYKSFEDFESAKKAFVSDPILYLQPKKTLLVNSDFIQEALAVDAACDDRGNMEYQGIDLKTKKKIFHQGPFPNGTNNIGEFLAIVHALAFLQKQNLTHVAIYTDSVTALSWIKKKKHNSKSTQISPVLIELLERAEKWLQKYNFSNPLLKWQTKNWGENPADFGRK